MRCWRSTASISTSASAGKGNNNTPPGNPDPPGQLIDLQLLAFNDYHGHVESTTPGTILDKPAGGGEYLSAKLSELRAPQAPSCAWTTASA